MPCGEVGGMSGHADTARPLAPPTVSALTEEVIPPQRSLAARVGNLLLGVWGAVTGVAPHVLHHVGPLAGAAFLAGAGGRLLFAGIALVVSIPFLLRIYRRFHTWIAPATALVVMAAMFSLSTFVIGPAISGESSDPQRPTVDRSHDEHH